MSGIAIVYQGRSPSERRSNKDFSGTDAEKIKAALGSIKINPEMVSQFYLLPDKPLSTFLTSSKSKVPMWTPEGSSEVRKLADKLAELSPHIVFTVGDIATYALTGRWGIHNLRGSVFNSSTIGRYVAPILPYSFVRNGNAQWEWVYFRDIFTGLIYKEPDPKTLKIHPSYGETLAYLNNLNIQGLNGKTVYFDIETKYDELNCISFSTGPSEAWCIPFVHKGGMYFTPGQETFVMQAIGDLLTDPRVRKAGQNLAFDIAFLRRKYGFKITNFDDTMVAQNLISPELPKDLGFIASIYTDVPFYKGEGKEWLEGGDPYSKLWRYNCLDSLVCAQALPCQLNILEAMENTEAYRRDLKSIEPRIYMEQRENCRDFEAIERRKEWIRQKIEEMTPEGVNLKSPKSVSRFLGLSGSSFLEVKKAAERGCPKALVIYRIKEREQEIAKVESDVKYILPDEGYTLYTAEPDQPEERIVAHICESKEMISSLGTGDRTGDSLLNYGYDLRYIMLHRHMEEKAAKSYEKYYSAFYPEIKGKYHPFVIESLKKSKGVVNLMGRRINFFSGISAKTLRKAYAAIPKTTTSDILEERGIQFIYYNERFKNVQLLFKTETSIGFQISGDRHDSILEEIKKSLELPLKTPDGKEFYIPVNISEKRHG